MVDSCKSQGFREHHKLTLKAGFCLVFLEVSRQVQTQGRVGGLCTAQSFLKILRKGEPGKNQKKHTHSLRQFRDGLLENGGCIFKLFQFILMLEIIISRQ